MTRDERTFNPELPDCYEYEEGDVVEIRVCCNPVTWERAIVTRFTNSHGWEMMCYLAEPGPWLRTRCIDQACQVRPAR